MSEFSGVIKAVGLKGTLNNSSDRDTGAISTENGWRSAKPFYNRFIPKSVEFPSFAKDYFIGFSLQSATGETVPAPPVLSISVAGLRVDINWTLPIGVDGVVLYHAPSDLSYIGSLDMMTNFMPHLELFHGFAYYVALIAYTDTGLTSGYSNVERITIP